MRSNAMRLAAMLACLFVFVSMLARADDSSSKPTAISPGTFLFLGETHRIAGIDTPRLGSEAGCPEERELAERAMARLDELFKGVVVVKRTNEIVDGARLATIYVDGNNLTGIMRKDEFAVPSSISPHKWCPEVSQLRESFDSETPTGTLAPSEGEIDVSSKPGPEAPSALPVEPNVDSDTPTWKWALDSLAAWWGSAESNVEALEFVTIIKVVVAIFALYFAVSAVSWFVLRRWG